MYKSGNNLSAIKSVFACGKCLCLLSFCRGAPRLSGKKPTHHPFFFVAPCILVVLVCVPPSLFHSPPPRHLPRPRPLASKRESKMAGRWLRLFYGGWSCWLLLFRALLLLLLSALRAGAFFFSLPRLGHSSSSSARFCFARLALSCGCAADRRRRTKAARASAALTRRGFFLPSNALCSFLWRPRRLPRWPCSFLGRPCSFLWRPCSFLWRPRAGSFGGFLGVLCKI